jgi:hypothetical protein
VLERRLLKRVGKNMAMVSPWNVVAALRLALPCIADVHGVRRLDEVSS